MIAGQVFGPNLFLVTSNSGILIYMISMTIALYVIRDDIRQAGDLGNFLIALESARSEIKRDDDRPSSVRTLSYNDSKHGKTAQPDTLNSAIQKHVV